MSLNCFVILFRGTTIILVMELHKIFILILGIVHSSVGQEVWVSDAHIYHCHPSL